MTVSREKGVLKEIYGMPYSAHDARARASPTEDKATYNGLSHRSKKALVDKLISWHCTLKWKAKLRLDVERSLCPAHAFDGRY